MLTDGAPSGEVVVGEGGDSVSGRISRADVARLMVASLFTPEVARRTFEIASRDGLRGTPTNIIQMTWVEPGAV